MAERAGAVPVFEVLRQSAERHGRQRVHVAKVCATNVHDNTCERYFVIAFLLYAVSPLSALKHVQGRTKCTLLMTEVITKKRLHGTLV